ncbi:MAG: hypothetical protein Q8R79_08095 [Legionellaceae bacterium]|nr:hypothetical protein [Legionellaceae bacterium]
MSHCRWHRGFKTDGDDGLACRKKFSNNGNGVSAKVTALLNKFADMILNEEWKPVDTDTLTMVDILVLASNHKDQEPRPNITKEELEAKQTMVLKWLRAANKISPACDIQNLAACSPRLLSTLAQTHHHLGKAERYAQTPLEARMTLLSNALSISEYLASLNCSEEQDPHAYQNRIPTYTLPINYSLQELEEFDAAAELMKKQLTLSSPFHVTQAYSQLTIIRTKQYEKGHNPNHLQQALSYAKKAVEVSAPLTEAPIVQYNARVCLMNTYQMADQAAEAQEIARAILHEIDTNPKCQAKANHREAAQKILAVNTPAPTMM